MSTPPTRNVYTIRPLPSGSGTRGSLSTSISMGPHGLVRSLLAASPTPPTRHHLDANASTLSASPRTSRIRRDFTSLGRHPLANDGEDDTTFGDDEEDPDDWTIVDKLRMWRHDAMMQHLYDTAIFWGDKVLTWTGDPNDAFWLAQTHFLTNQYSRAERLLTRPFNFSATATQTKGTAEQPLDMIQGEGVSRLVDVSVACRYLAAQCQVKSGNWTEAMEMLGDSNPFAGSSNSGSKIPNSDGGIKVEASMCYLRGLLMLRLNRADRAKECLLEALALDVKCYEAFELLVGGEMMGIDEEWALIEGLAYREQAQEQAEFVKLMYTTRLKKFKHHAEIDAARKKLMEEYNLAENPDVLFGHADSLYAEYRWADCFAITSRILDLEAVHPSTLPLHLACMTALPHLHSRLFLLAHELVAHEPDSPSSWYAVGLWYLAVKRFGEAKKYFSKTSLMDPRFGPAWIAFAHAFAYEGEHDQAIVAYSTSARLFPGSHLPQLFIGMEHIQLSNMQLAESHLAASAALCDSDPILFNELGVVAYENRKYDEALTHFSNAVSRAKEVRGSQTMWATLYVNQAHAFRKMGQLQEAKEGYMRVLEIEPRHMIAIASLGITHHLLFELEDAIARYHEALGIEPLAAHVVGLLDSALQANSDVPVHMISGLGKDDEWEVAMEQRNRAQEAHRTQHSQAKENSNATGLSGISEADSSAMDLTRAIWQRPITFHNNARTCDLAPPSAPAINPAPVLTEEQESVYGIVLKHYSSPAYVIPGVDAQKAALTEEEKMWLTRECLLRYLRASKWVLATTITRLDETLKWRREYGLYDLITPEHVEPESLTGKEQLAGYDSERRPALYMIPSRQNTEESPRQLQFAVWMLERAVDAMGPGVENLDLLINFADRGKNPSISTSKNMLYILQNHYPERLGLAVIINVPTLINLFFKGIMPFVDPITRAKVKFNPDIIKEGIFDKSQAVKEWGGEMDFIYEHEKSWKPLVDLCNNLRIERTERWKKLGGSVGLSEWDIKGGAPQPKVQRAATTEGATDPQNNLSPKTTVSRKDLPESKSDTVLV